VLVDVSQGKVSAKAARDDYGVVLFKRKGLLAVDEKKTAALRKRLTAKRKDRKLPMIDRGPGYDKFLKRR